MSATEPNMMRGLNAGALASERVPQRSQDPSLGTISRRLASDFKAFTHAVTLQVTNKVHAISLNRDVAAELIIKGNQLQFRSLGDFEFAIASRAEPPAQRVMELEKLTLFELRRMATDIRKLDRRLSDVLAAALEGGQSLGGLMVELEIKLFSTDHDWRAIFVALAASNGPRLDGYRHVALAKYMQYLGERQSVIQRIYANRGTDAERGQAQAEEVKASQGQNNALQETSIFDFTQIQVGGVTADDLYVLPRGESIAVTLTGTEEVDLILARFPFKLVPGDRTYLVDPNGVDYVLSPGRNTIGRSQGCDIMVEVEYREVSRKHLVIDRIDAQTVVLTDLSSHGTHVPASRVVGARPTSTDSHDITMVGAGPGASPRVSPQA